MWSLIPLVWSTFLPPLLHCDVIIIVVIGCVLAVVVLAVVGLAAYSIPPTVAL